MSTSEEFPFERANRVFEQFEDAYSDQFGTPIDPLEFDFDGYDGEYFKDLCDRVLAGKRQGMGHVIRSAGTLGGGNHFVEFARARESGDYWLVIHSGSRYLGMAVAEYWQSRASDLRAASAIRDALSPDYHEYLAFDPDEVTDEELWAWVTGGMGQSHLRKGKIREEFEKRMDGIYSESVVDEVIDEAPMAYKSAQSIVEAIEPTAEVVDWLDVVHNLKARD